MRVISIFRYDRLWSQGPALTILGSLISTFRIREVPFMVGLKNHNSPLKLSPIANGSRKVRPKVLSRRPCSIPRECVLFFWCNQYCFNSRSVAMEWTTPQHEEIDLNCEISSYANAEL